MYKARRPFGDLIGLQEDMQRLLNAAIQPGQTASVRRGGWLPALDIYETDDSITVTADLPGVKTEDLDLTVEESVLTVSGIRRAGSGPEDANYHRIERPFGEFQRSIQLPNKVDAERITASLVDGVLSIRIPIAGASSSRKIAVDSKHDHVADTQSDKEGEAG